MNKLQEAGLLVSLTIHSWTARKTDRQVSSVVNHEYEALPNASRVQKNLFSKYSLAEIRKWESRLRSYHSTHTIPWARNGLRYLHSKHFMAYRDKMSELKNHHAQAKRKFIDAYAVHIAAARHTLGKMFDETLYPSVDKLEEMFGVELDFQTIPDSDFRIQLNDQMLSELRKEVASETEKRFAEAQRHLVEKIDSTMRHLHKRLNENLTKAKGTMLDPVFELIEILPEININDDPRIDQIAAELHQVFENVDVPKLKNSESLQVELSGKTKQVLDNINQWGLL